MLKVFLKIARRWRLHGKLPGRRYREVEKEEALANIREAIVECIMSLAEERVLGLVHLGLNKPNFSL